MVLVQKEEVSLLVVEEESQFAVEALFQFLVEMAIPNHGLSNDNAEPFQDRLQPQATLQVLSTVMDSLCRAG